MEKHKTYKFFRGLLMASAFTSVMFVMQACYGTPNNARIDDEILEYTVSGTVTAKPNAEPLAGIKLTVDSTDYETVTDSLGNFSITLKASDYCDMTFKFVDESGKYQQLDTVVPVCNSPELNIEMDVNNAPKVS